jgi:hypothetical protein
VAGVSAILAGGVAAAVWTWVLGEPFGLTGLVVGIVVNVVVFAVGYWIAGGERSPARTTVSEGE